MTIVHRYKILKVENSHCNQVTMDSKVEIIRKHSLWSRQFMTLLSWLLPVDHAIVKKRILGPPHSQSLGFISTRSSEVVTHITGLRQQVVKSVLQREHLIKEVLCYPLMVSMQHFQSWKCQCFIVWSIWVNNPQGMLLQALNLVTLFGWDRRFGRLHEVENLQLDRVPTRWWDDSDQKEYYGGLHVMETEAEAEAEAEVDPSAQLSVRPPKVSVVEQEVPQLSEALTTLDGSLGDLITSRHPGFRVRTVWQSTREFWV